MISLNAIFNNLNLQKLYRSVLPADLSIKTYFEQSKYKFSYPTKINVDIFLICIYIVNINKIRPIGQNKVHWLPSGSVGRTWPQSTILFFGIFCYVILSQEQYCHFYHKLHLFGKGKRLYMTAYP